MSNYLDTPIEYLKGVGPQRADLLKKELQLFTIGDLLFYFPYRYVDRSRFYAIAEVTEDSHHVQIKGRIMSMQEVGQKRGKRLVARFKDDSGEMELVWFRGLQWIKKYLMPNTEYIAFGKPSLFNGTLNIVHPDMEPAALRKPDQGGFQPMYNSTEKLKSKSLDSKGILKLVKAAMADLKPDFIGENIPKGIVQQYGFISRYQALVNIHLPQNEKMGRKARGRLKFEELFLTQVRLLQLKSLRNDKFKGFVMNARDELVLQLFQSLPFDLTGAQVKVLKDIRNDIQSGNQMNRLLQGDVGSGKTIVALLAMLMANDNGFQAAMMAPTEILAQQHLETLNEYVKELPINVALLTGSIKGAERKAILEAAKAGELNILVGTHALIEDKVKFANLGLVVIDEQHRFGVAQRARLRDKNSQPPHVLVMTATPIPRTLAMTVYGDLDTSKIDELPPGRKPIQTKHYRESARLKVFGFMKEQIKLGRQVYVVYPLIEESKTLDYKDLMDGYESITKAFPEYHVSVVHGRMKAEDKDFEMQRFASGQTHIMVATTVIEVGVNVPNASVMVIESAERFGLSQLHQLRGRVGRGSEQSYCVLMTGNKLSNDARTRMTTMVQTNDGFKIAEVDLHLRGPGDIEGTQQSGIANLKLANIVKDEKILQEARYAAKQVLEEDPHLERPENLGLRRFMQQFREKQREWSRIA